MLIAILEDDAGRTAAMLRVLASLPAAHAEVWDNSTDCIAWLGQHLPDVALLSLDHDLGPNRLGADGPFDPGLGRDVTAWLADQMPSCPVIIHTSNATGAERMQRDLDEGGWAHRRVVPFSDLDWIGTTWLGAVRELLQP